MTIPAVVNHLWQASCFVLLAGLLAFALRNSSPKIRYWIWLSASLKFLLPFALLVSLGSVIPHPARHSEAVPAPVFPSTIVQIAQPFSIASGDTAPVHTSLDLVPVVIGVIWIIGFLAITLARFRSWLRIRAVLRTSTPIELPIPVPALITPGAQEPGIVGFLRPVLVLPAHLLEHLDPRQFEAILTHEMCHVRRRDNFFAAVHMAVEAIFWFHPLVWWIGSRLVEERELACDEEVLRMGYEPADYVQGMLKVCRFYTESSLPCISGVTGADLKKRIGAILAEGGAPELSVGKKVILATIGLAALATPILIGVLNAPAIRAQNAPATMPKFEVASIKPTGTRGEAWIQPMPGQLTARARLWELMQAAYQVQDFQIVGGPEWVKSDVYEVSAKASANPQVAQMLLMLQSLLEERFQLRTHRESRLMPVYALTPARGGLKLPPTRDGSCIEEEAPPPGQGDGVPLPRCGGIDGRPESKGHHMVGGKVPMPEFVRKLSEVLGRTVMDQTGFSGVFDIDLEFRRDETTDLAGRLGIVSAGPALPDTSIPSIFSAVQQLGLRLESTTGPVPVFVIDHVERPSVD